MNFFILFLVGAAFLSAKLISFDIGFFQLSIYRGVLAIAPLLMLLVRNDRAIAKLLQSKNIYSYKFMLFWAIYSFFSVIVVKDFTAWARSLSFLIAGVFSILIIGIYLTNKKTLYRAFMIIEFFVMMYCLHGYYEIITGDYRYIDEVGQSFYNQMSINKIIIGMLVPVSVFGNPNNFGFFCVVGFYVSMICSKISTSKLTSAYCLFAGISSVVLLLLSQSRSALHGFLLSLLYLGILFIINVSIVKKMFLITIVFFASVGYVFWTPFLGDYYDPIIILFISGEYGESENIRINLIQNGLIFLKDSWFLGVGMGNIEYHMEYYAERYVSAVTNMHNWWIEILVSSGIFVFAGYIIMYIKNVLLLQHVARKADCSENRFIAKALLGFMIAFIVGSMGASTNITEEWLWVFWGIVFAFGNYASVEK